MKNYDPKQIEAKWQKVWADTKLYEVSDDDPRPKHYELEYFPYPSGVTMHVGHVRNYVISDVFARYKRMTGHNVLHPMGWDAFGLPAENQAIKTGQSPRESTDANVKIFKRQLMQVGLSYDWSREIDSSRPDYYKWTQWLFLLFYKRGLAYKDEAAVNWCPHDKTVLANEQVIKKDGVNVCERCENPVVKRQLSQWFFKITEYADRLANDLDELDWPEHIKTMQRNWIGRSSGAELEFKIDGASEKIKVFTTRVDTLFGATFIVLAPEHPLVEKITSGEQKKAVETYVTEAASKSDIERQENHEKTGVFTGAYAINPATNEKIPVWTADYVLAGYGHGAVMAVPAHDERDYEFAQKFDLPIKQVVAVEHTDPINPPKADEEFHDRTVLQCIVKHPTEDKIIILDLSAYSDAKYTFVTGGLEEGESVEDGAVREVLEETGYKNTKAVYQLGGEYFGKLHHPLKKVNRRAHFVNVVVELDDLEQNGVSDEEKSKHKVLWVNTSDADEYMVWSETQKLLERYRGKVEAYGGEGILIDSGKYTGMSSSEARDEMASDFGKEHVNYKMRDWLISRQRYWGAPIPIVYCKDCGAQAVPEDQLPVVLPPLEVYQPSDDGRSPLARVDDFVHTTCPKCDGPAERETDTMDTFVDSSWYFLRFADPHNDEAAFDPAKVAHWLPVDTYVGGAEHAVAHLLFARFWTKVLHDEGLVPFVEPFKTLRTHGMIGGSDGRKMGKRYGNVVTPDDVIEQGYGADSLRLYELFVGPYNQGVDWNPNGIDGTRRLLLRLWGLVQEHAEAVPGEANETLETALMSAVHRALFKVTKDLEGFALNTAVAAVMELTNELYRIKTELPIGNPVWGEALKIVTLMIAPMAPHIAEETRQLLGGTESVHLSGWPAYDAELIKQEVVQIAIQVNGKLRGTMPADADMSDDDLKAQAAIVDTVVKHLEDKQIVKTIVVPKKLVNFVVK